MALNIFTSCLCDSIFAFLKQNYFIEAEIQKGFTPKIAGVLEHTSMMANSTDKVRIKQPSLAITLLDLTNTFCEIYRQLDSRNSLISPYPCQSQAFDFKPLYWLPYINHNWPFSYSRYPC